MKKLMLLMSLFCASARAFDLGAADDSPDKTVTRLMLRAEAKAKENNQKIKLYQLSNPGTTYAQAQQALINQELAVQKTTVEMKEQVPHE